MTNSFILEVVALEDLDEEIKLIVGETKVISTRSPTRVVIGNPQVADIADVSNSEITLSAKSAGVTTLVFWDVFGEQSVKIKVLSEDLEVLKRRIDNLLKGLNLPEVYTLGNEDEGKVLILGRVKNPQDRERITTVLGALKEKTIDLIVVKEEEAVVEIDVQVLELDKDATRTLGFTFPTSSTLTFTETGSPGISTAGTKFSTLFQILNLRRTAFVWTIDALVQEGKARVLSRPRLACQSGKEAKLLVGGEVPIFTATVSTAGVTTGEVEYKEYGIILNIKPKVEESRRINLSLGVEVSELGTVETTTYGRAYPLKKRNAFTELFLDDGQTLAIGGLIKQKTEEDIEKLPWLGDIPILGLFFRKKTTRVGGGTGERGDTELFITLTPTIVSEGKAVVQAKKELKSKIVLPPAIEKILPEPIAGYTRIIQKRILENLTYPAQAKQAGFEGKLKLSLHLSYQGELLDAVIKDPSGYKILDDNAVSVAKGITPYPPFPSSIEEKELWIDIPIIYSLD